MSNQELNRCPVRDKLREMLLPAVLLTVLGSVWAVGYSHEREDDVDRGTPALTMPGHRSAAKSARRGNRVADISLDQKVPGD